MNVYFYRGSKTLQMDSDMKMKTLILLITCLTVSAEVTNTLTVLPFCSGRSVHYTFSPKSTILTPDSFNEFYLDGSNAAISSFLSQPVTGISSCTCTVKNAGDLIQSLNVRHYADGLYKECGKSINVVKFGDNAIHRFGCAEGELLQLDSIEEEGNLTVTLYVKTPRPDDVRYKVRLEPVKVAADLMVTCWPPVMVKTTTSTPTSSSSSTSSSTSSTTSSIPGVISTTSSQNSNHKAVLIGVVSAVMVTVIVIMTCFLCFMCIRRRSQRKKDKKTAASDPERNVDAETRQNTPQHTSLYNTVSHVYASIRSNAVVAGLRKKASLPKNALDRLRGRTKRNIGVSEPYSNTASGFYDSIKSNSGNGNRSVNSDDVLHAPRVDKLALTRHDSCESEQYIHATTSDDSRPPMTAQLSTDSDKYINPVVDSKEQRKVSVVPEETDDSLNDDNKSGTDDYLEPVKTCYGKQLSIREDPYTIMNKNENTGPDKDCYMTGRPRYLDTLKKNTAKRTEIKMTEMKENAMTEMKDQDSNPDSVYVNQKSLNAFSSNDKESKDTKLVKVAVPKTPVSVHSSGEYIPMDSNSPVLASDQEDTGYFSMRRDDNLSLGGDKDYNCIALDNSANTAHSGSLPNNNTRDSGYDDPITSFSRSNGATSDKVRAESENTNSSTDVNENCEDIFDLATIHLGMPMRDTDQTERKMENISKPKLKRYVKQ